jgi:hypothetical protein
MIKEFVERFMARKSKLEAMFSEKHPENYKEIVKSVATVLNNGEHYGGIDPERIHEIDDGYYQGTLVYVIAATGCQPSDYWYVKVSYGSCPVCDILEGIRGCSFGKPTPEQVCDYMTLALHIVEALRKMVDDEVERGDSVGTSRRRRDSL